MRSCPRRSWPPPWASSGQQLADAIGAALLRALARSSDVAAPTLNTYSPWPAVHPQGQPIQSGRFPPAGRGSHIWAPFSRTSCPAPTTAVPAPPSPSIAATGRGRSLNEKIRPEGQGRSSARPPTARRSAPRRNLPAEGCGVAWVEVPPAPLRALETRACVPAKKTSVR